jgi:hypothetical protein
VERHRCLRLDRDRVYALISAYGPPRLWQRAVEAAAAGFEQGVVTHPPGEERVTAALDRARRHLDALHWELVDEPSLDAAVLALALEADAMSLKLCGPGRAYLHRDGQITRLTPRQTQGQGVRTASPAAVQLTLEPKDTLFAGSESAFSRAAVERVAAVLQQSPTTPPQVLAELLSDPAKHTADGALALALRIE